MSRVDAAAASDRLPWLSDEPKPKPSKHARSGVLGWVAALVVAVAGAGFWLGTRAIEEQPTSVRQPASTTIPLPERRALQPDVRMPAQPEVRPAPAPEVRRPAAPEVRIAQVRPTARAEARSAAPEEKAEQAPVTEQTAPAPEPVVAAPKLQRIPLRPWQPRVVGGAAGRLVEIGAFGSVPQAKLGWRHMVRTYPAVAHLPAVVRPDRNSRGRMFYRFRIGTTSQAHSEILCQRMQRIHFSCAVVGLPWKSKVER
jgi:hypothetical protein